MGQRSQHNNSPPLRHTAQKSSFSIGTGGPFLAPGVRGGSLGSSEAAPSTSEGRCPGIEVTVTFLPPRLGVCMASELWSWLTLGRREPESGYSANKLLRCRSKGPRQGQGIHLSQALSPQGSLSAGIAHTPGASHKLLTTTGR